MRVHGVCWCAIFSTMGAGCGLLLDMDPSSMDASVVRGDAGDASRDDASRNDAGRDDAGRDDAGREDAGRRDAGRDACVVLGELCNSLDDDCDGWVDEGFDLFTDPMRCGDCETVCPSAGGLPSCDTGMCQLTCASDRADCDDDLANGCETDLGQPETCGGCDSACPAVCQPTGAGFTCVVACGAGRVDCDGACVDTATDTDNCGGCGTPCFDDPHGVITCMGGGCVVNDCGDMRENCDGDPSTAVRRGWAARPTATPATTCAGPDNGVRPAAAAELLRAFQRTDPAFGRLCITLAALPQPRA